MRLTRIHVKGPLTVGGSHRISGNAANHITRVLRLRAGDPLTLFDGNGGEYTARIEQLGRDEVLVAVGEHHAVDRESSLRLTLAQGVSRGERMDWVIQKATELGVHRIVPVLTERTVVRLDARQAERKLQHWQAVAVAACEQCGRNRVPEVTAPVRLRELLQNSASGETRVLLSPVGTLGVRDLAPSPMGLTVLIGPEGGLSESEQAEAVAAGFQAVRLGPRILRTETAAIAALTIIQRDFGDL